MSTCAQKEVTTIDLMPLDRFVHKENHLFYLDRPVNRNLHRDEFEVYLQNNSIIIERTDDSRKHLAEYKFQGEIIYRNRVNLFIHKDRQSYKLMSLHVEVNDDSVFTFISRYDIKIEPCDRYFYTISNDIITLQSLDRKTIYLYDFNTGKKLNTKTYNKPVLFECLDKYDDLTFGYDGENIISHKVSKDFHINDMFFKLSKTQNSIEKAFFQIGSYQYRLNYLDLYDGEYLWRFDMNLMDNPFISNPLEIKGLGRGFNNMIYPYSDGTCLVRLNGKDLNIVKVDDKKWEPVIYRTYFLYGCENNNNYLLRVFSFSMNNKKEFSPYKYRDVKYLKSDLPIDQKIMKSDWLSKNEYSTDYTIIYLYSRNRKYKFNMPDIIN